MEIHKVRKILLLHHFYQEQGSSQPRIPNRSSQKGNPYILQDTLGIHLSRIAECSLQCTLHKPSSRHENTRGKFRLSCTPHKLSPRERSGLGKFRSFLKCCRKDQPHTCHFQLCTHPDMNCSFPLLHCMCTVHSFQNTSSDTLHLRVCNLIDK